MQQTFIDLDELIVRCKDKLSKKFIQEAVACYRGGAFRSSIVATWNAVVFDFLHKLRQLEQTGNDEASNLLKNFENMSINADYKRLWDFESKIPDIALKKFELISPVEQIDITRLFEDRSRCAHPSMTSLEEPFEATAELARYHLRSAVLHLIQHPPVQGRAAKSRIFEAIKSEYFPIKVEEAVEYFRKGPLARSRPTLVKDVVKGLTISLITKDFLEDERARQFSALNAVAIIYSQETQNILNDELSDIILDKVEDENWNKVIIYLRKIQAWEKLNEPCQIKAKSFIEKLNIYSSSQDIFECNVYHLRLENLDIVLNAIYIDFLKESAVKKICSAPTEIILKIKEYCEELEDTFLVKQLDSILIPYLPEITNNIIKEFVASSSFANAKYNALQLLRVDSYLNTEQWKFVLDGFRNNNQIYGSWGCPEVIASLFKKSVKLHRSIENHWLSFRQELNDDKFNNVDTVNELKELIDSYSSMNNV